MPCAKKYRPASGVSFRRKGWDAPTLTLPRREGNCSAPAKNREAEFFHTTTNRRLPSYQLWMQDGDANPAMRIFLRKSDDAATNPPRHDFFISLLEKYPGPIVLPEAAYGASGGRP